MTSISYYYFKFIDKINKIFLVFVILIVIQGKLSNGGKPATSNKSEKLVENIRRQLMENNYDYFPSAEESATPAHFDLDHNDPLYSDNDTSPDSSEGADRQPFAPRAILSEENSKPDDHAISKKDLLYYMDDKRLRRSNDVVEPEDFDNDNDKTSPKVKYKVLKIKSVHPNRRSASLRRYIQEENEQGVSIVSVDGAPFPEFLLPRSRRQYMQDSAEGVNATGDAAADTIR
ncbi:hypothetical protein ABMA28_010758 [Loxostege sticticalis]|uniref:Uncharacterized protein n=1 Tax=Loxostege sticticalis TaxID=481309 RepID=A0ABD0SAB8_LOXSC